MILMASNAALRKLVQQLSAFTCRWFDTGLLLPRCNAGVRSRPHFIFLGLGVSRRRQRKTAASLVMADDIAMRSHDRERLAISHDDEIAALD